jgi:hypothetical protein
VKDERQRRVIQRANVDRISDVPRQTIREIDSVLGLALRRIREMHANVDVVERQLRQEGTVQVRKRHRRFIGEQAAETGRDLEPPRRVDIEQSLVHDVLIVAGR